MTSLFAITVATLLLAAFLVINGFSLIVREVQHKRHMRERDARVSAEVLSAVNLRAQVQGLTDANDAAARLDVAMRKSIGEGIDLAQVLALRNQELADLVELRGVQKAEEENTLDVWCKVRDDLSAFADKYPAYLWTKDEGAKS